MFKVITNRGAGKTATLMRYANQLAKENPDKQVLFVGNAPSSQVKRFITEVGPLPSNLGFISYSYYMDNFRGKRCVAVVDDLDCWLASNFNVVGYSNTVGE